MRSEYGFWIIIVFICALTFTAFVTACKEYNLRAIEAYEKCLEKIEDPIHCRAGRP